MTTSTCPTATNAGASADCSSTTIDRGTRYELQSGRRVESVLASLTPLTAWKYDYQPEAGSPEARLYSDFVPPCDWLAQKSPPVDNSGD